MNELKWFVGSNGNIFVDHNDYRYCIARLPTKDGYSVARNGIEIARVPSIADGNVIVRRECR